jgi:hypothetical protein
LALLRERNPDRRMFTYLDLVYQVIVREFQPAGWSGPDLVAVATRCNDFQAGYAEHPGNVCQEHPDNVRLLQAIWQLIADGIVYPRLRSMRDDQPASIHFLVLTDRGLDVIVDADHPRRPGFAGRFAAKHPEVSVEVVARLDDAAVCLERGVLRAAIVMLGLAFEETLRAAYDAVALPAAPPPKIARDFLAALRNHVASLSMAKAEDRHVLSIALVAAESVRTERNRAAHPSAVFDDTNAVEELLVSASRQIPVIWDRLIKPAS